MKCCRRLWWQFCKRACWGGSAAWLAWPIPARSDVGEAWRLLSKLVSGVYNMLGWAECSVC